MLVGIMLVIAAACVGNNYLDRDIDKAMARTRQRALVAGTISGRAALLYGLILLATGSLVLGSATTGLALLMALAGFVAYVGLYTWAKRRTAYGTLLGSISGAIPPLVGYAAVTGRLDGTAGLLFLTVGCWQMPHFYAIALYRQSDYRAAHIPIWPLRKGRTSTKYQMVIYAFLFAVVSLLLGRIARLGWSYTIIMALAGLYWLGRALQGLWTVTDAESRWARRMFLDSLVIILIFSILLAVGPLLP